MFNVYQACVCVFFVNRAIFQLTCHVLLNLENKSIRVSLKSRRNVIQFNHISQKVFSISKDICLTTHFRIAARRWA
jgi:hypothetical protein